MVWSTFLGHVLAGFLVAACCTPAGVSGAFLLLPVQVHAFGAPSPRVSATNLLYNAISTPAGAIGYWRSDRLDTHLARSLLLGTVPGVVAGVAIRSTALAAEERFAVVSGVVLGVLGARLVLEAAGWQPRRPVEEDRTIPLARLVAVGVAGGFIGGVYGLGGAAVIVPWLVQVERIPMRRISGAGLVITLVTSIVGLATFALASWLDLGQADAPDWAAGLALGLGGVAGALVGVRLQPRIPVGLLKALLGIAAFSAAVRMLA